MKSRFFEQYQSYKQNASAEAGQELASRLYQQLGRWLEREEPDAAFLDEFERFFADLDERDLNPRDLIDLGLVHTAEAVQSFRQLHEERNAPPEALAIAPRDEAAEGPEAMRFYLGEARLPFFAFMEEDAYRTLKNFDFTEVDFQIFEILQGPFPHDAAQKFLLENNWVDIWITLRYLDSLPESGDLGADLLEQVLLRRETMHEKLILLAYIFMARPELIDRALREEGDGEPADFNFPPELPQELLRALKLALDNAIGEGGELHPAFEQKMAPGYENETLFFLLVYFEIAHAPVGPGWIRLFERGAANHWTSSSLEDGQEVLYQPVAEFSGSLLGLLNDDELGRILETSLLLPNFFEAIDRYNPEAFQNFLLAVGRMPQLLVQELELALPRRMDRRGPDSLRLERLRHTARQVGYDVVSEAGGRPLLIRRETA